MNIYLASGFRQRFKLRELADTLQLSGHKICSSWIWLDERPEREDKSWDIFAEIIADKNVSDLSMADALVVDAYGITETNHGGVSFETGFCFARGKPIYLVGPKGNTFHWLDEILNVGNYQELLEHL